jgi:hypothetical protein
MTHQQYAEFNIRKSKKSRDGYGCIYSIQGRVTNVNYIGSDEETIAQYIIRTLDNQRCTRPIKLKSSIDDMTSRSNYEEIPKSTLQRIKYSLSNIRKSLEVII